MSEYEIGYKKPPRQTRFRKGESGNGKGRPKGKRNLKTELMEELQATIVVTEGGKRRAITRQRAMIKRLTAAALHGDVRPAALLLNLMLQVERAQDAGAGVTPSTQEDQRILERFLRRARRSFPDGGK